MLKLKIANVVIEYDYFHKDFFENRLSAYIYSGDEKPQFKLKYEVLNNIQNPKPKTSKQIGNWLVGELESGNLFSALIAKSGRVIAYNENTPDYSVCYSAMIPIEKKNENDLADVDREYLRGSASFNNYLISHGGTTLHSSCISYKNNAVLFSAPPGTGKSTHTELWKKAFPKDVKYINDDKPAIIKENGAFFAAGTPWSGKTDRNTNAIAPIKSIVFVERANENSIEKLSTAKAVCYLNDQTFPSFYDERLFSKNLDVIEDIIKSVPVYVLKCNTNMEAAHIAKNTIFGTEE